MPRDGQTGRVDLAAIAAELYGLAPKDLIAARDARAAEARTAGDKDLATSLKHLRKPSVGAWMANMLVRQQPRDINRLIELGATLRPLGASKVPRSARPRNRSRRPSPSWRPGPCHRRQGRANRSHRRPSSSSRPRSTLPLRTPRAAVAPRGGPDAGLHYSGLGFGVSHQEQRTAPRHRCLQSRRWRCREAPPKCPRRSAKRSRRDAMPSAPIPTSTRRGRRSPRRRRTSSGSVWP